MKESILYWSKVKRHKLTTTVHDYVKCDEIRYKTHSFYNFNKKKISLNGTYKRVVWLTVLDELLILTVKW
jgi:hypothetical protein